MLPNDIYNKRILLSPLNWGMGHVSRCIPLIALLLKNNNILFVAGDESQLEIFRQYFPQITFIQHLGYPFKFKGKGNFSLDLLKQFGPLRNRLKRELLEVDEIIEKYNIDMIVSDHRYGFRSNKIDSIILTHQLNLPLKWYEGWVQKIHSGYLNMFTEIWVPDTLNSDYAGDLSLNTKGFRTEYIGALSRFSMYEKATEQSVQRVFVVSGPEVYAKGFIEEQLRAIVNDNTESIIIASASLIKKTSNNNINIQASNDWKACDQIILKSNKIISRCGFSTLMDLIILKKPFEISPTPGQREQEYLFDLWHKKAHGVSRPFV